MDLRTRRSAMDLRRSATLGPGNPPMDLATRKSAYGLYDPETRSYVAAKRLQG